MKTSIRHFASVVALIFTLTALCGCDPDWWDGRTDLDGSWRVVEVSGYSNYQPGDNWYFYRNGAFSTHGYDLPSENGWWSRRGRSIQISFGERDVDISAYVRDYDNDYMVLDVTDYDYGYSYTLRLVREAYY